jgi:broad specificity phosphatase PhoE
MFGCLQVQEHPLLRERFFGAALELVSHDNYCPAWEGDARHPATKPAGNEDGESVSEVSARLQQLFQVSNSATASHVNPP